MAENPLKKMSSGLKGLKDRDYSAQKELLSKLLPLAKKLTIQLAILAAKLSSTLSEVMRGVGSKLQEKVPQFAQLSNLLLFYTLWSAGLEIMNFIQMQGYFWTFVLKTAPLWVFALGLSADSIKNRLEAKDRDEEAED